MLVFTCTHPAVHSQRAVELFTQVYDASAEQGTLGHLSSLSHPNLSHKIKKLDQFIPFSNQQPLLPLVVAMKLAIFASAYLASVASASLFNLRSSSSSKPSPSQFTNARVSVFGLKKAVSKEDVETISSSLIEVYNEMFAHADMQMVSFETQASAAIPMELAELTG
jgi:hypothetical protein